MAHTPQMDQYQEEITFEASEITIGAVELKDGSSTTRESIQADGTAIPAAINDGALLIAGRDNGTQRHIRTNASGNLVVVVSGAAPLNTFTPAAPAQVTVGVASTAVVGADASRKYLALSVITAGSRISLHLAGGAAVLDTGITIFTGTTYIFDSSALMTGAVNAIANQAGVLVGVQEGT